MGYRKCGWSDADVAHAFVRRLTVCGSAAHRDDEAGWLRLAVGLTRAVIWTGSVKKVSARWVQSCVYEAQRTGCSFVREAGGGPSWGSLVVLAMAAIAWVYSAR